ncbi:MAG: GGDEF domain-containing protein [Lachnospiraceae bacterium]|nr:GGDEF domain-containing protein [Lachnospiraceae bacterium]
MRILREGEMSSRDRIDCKIYNCSVYIRRNFGVSSASEWYYRLVGDYSYLPLTRFICPEDAEILENAIDNLVEPVEVYTKIYRLADGTFRNIYLRMENCDRTEEGNRLWRIHMTDILDILDIEKRAAFLEDTIAKYRHFMTLQSEYYFEYTVNKNFLIMYKYVNEKSYKFVEQDLDEFIAEHSREEATEAHFARLNTFAEYLKSGSSSFEMQLKLELDGNEIYFGVKGGVYYKNKNIVAGIMTPNKDAVSSAYYLTPAARDVGTGLFNKKAATEYAIEKMHEAPGKLMWLVILDIDDFKKINDSFGHLFGDKVIRKVADTIQLNVGHRGIVGRFGGDEFFIFLDEVEDRQSLKTLLKTIVKEFFTAFDPQCNITVSIGVCQYPKDGESFEELFGKADKALYIAKEKGKNRHIIYDEKLHGAYDKDSINAQSVAFIASREKKRAGLINLVSKMHEKGAGYVVNNPEVQKELRLLFDLDGLTIYSGYGEEVLCRSGSYVCSASDRVRLFEDKKYEACFEKEDFIAISGPNGLKEISDEVYADAVKQEIGACVRCIARKEDKPFVEIDFDVFNSKRKWSENDIEMLGLIGCCLGRMIRDGM